MPTNSYGPGDNYDLNNSHVLPALIRKMHEAKVQSLPFVTVWGTGKPLREFIYSEDLADGCIYLLELNDHQFSSYLSDDKPPLINLGTGYDNSILDIAKIIAEVIGFKGEIQFDLSKPDGTPRKLLSVDLINKLGWRAQVNLREGIALAYTGYLNSLNAKAS
jgi:GDP-L-fucose synthase